MAAFRFFRLNITAWADGGAPGTSSGFTRVTEFELLDASDVAFPASNMTSNSAPSPLVASSSSVYGSGFEAFRAFDGDLSTGSRWISSGTGAQWLQVDLGSGNEIEVAKIKIAPDNQSGAYIVDFNLVASNTGAFTGEEVTLLTESGLTSGWTANTLRTFEIPLPELTVSGVVRDASGNPAARTVRICRRDTGLVLDSVESNGTTGAYVLTTTYTGELQRTVLDDDAGTLYNDIHDRVYAG